MSWWSRLLLAARFVRREIVSGELSILALALLVAVTALTSVSFFRPGGAGAHHPGHPAAGG
jgi:putative ABC transport system permease protein